ncbi:MAG: hypothetical protein KGH66_03275, partial [Candidatus Micrarchaeota archaeon]|nr:hypothetical protein [Candidatus Micrarchaeota archaeon]
ENSEVLSIGRERTFDKDTKDIEDVRKMLKELCKDVMAELNKQGFWFKGVSVKARYSDFTERIKNRKLGNFTDSESVLYTTGAELITPLIDRTVRKVGIRVYELNPKKGQKSL